MLTLCWVDLEASKRFVIKDEVVVNKADEHLQNSLANIICICAFFFVNIPALEHFRFVLTFVIAALEIHDI